MNIQSNPIQQKCMKINNQIKRSQKRQINYENPQFISLQVQPKQKFTSYKSSTFHRLQSPKISPSHPLPRQQSSILQSLLQSKINFYTNCKPCTHRLIPIIKNNIQACTKSNKIIKNIPELPRIYQLNQLISNYQFIYQLYSQKIQYHLDHFFLFYIDIVNAAIKQQYKIKIKQNSVLIESLLFISNALLQLGAQKLAFFFSFKGVKLCEMYGRYMEMGQMLILMGQVTMKLRRLQDCIILLKKGLQYLWRKKSSRSTQLQIQAYSIMSQCLLLMNMLQQSKIFAYKYQMGYSQKQQSKIKQLSKQSINSIQAKKNSQIIQQRISLNLQMLFEQNYEQYIKNNIYYFIKIDEKQFIQLFKINFEKLYQNFFHDQIFFYQIPLPLQILTNYQKYLKKKNNSKYHSTRTQSLKTMKNQLIIKDAIINAKKPKQLLMFNKRGGKISKQKLCNQFQKFINAIKQKLKNQKDALQQ